MTDNEMSVALLGLVILIVVASALTIAGAYMPGKGWAALLAAGGVMP
jgi:hypothetical protein